MTRIAKILISLVLLGSAAWFSLREIDYASLGTSVASFSIETLAWICVAIVLSSLIAAQRLRTIAADYGYPLGMRDAVAALSLGQVGGALLFQLVGQLMARGSYLKQHNIPVAGTVLITVQERAAAAIVSLALAAAGALYLFNRITFDVVGGGRDLMVLLLGISVATGAGAVVWRDKLQAVMAHVTPSAVLRFLRAVFFSLGVQLAMMAAYVYAGSIIEPGIRLPQLAGAAALVMFAASIPISFAGWGMREMSAVAAMSTIGMPADRALTIALLIGLLSLAIAAVLALLSARRTVTAPKEEPAAQLSRRDLDSSLMAVLPVLVAMLVFFQVHLPTKAGGLSVNLADPLALLAGAMFVLHLLRRGRPVWRVHNLGWMIAGCTGAMTIALLIGATSFGWTQWALTNKYLGWFVLLAYGATGALATRAGIERVLQTFVAAGCAIIVLCAVLNLVGYVWPLEDGKYPGFAQNSNAFAFQCLMVLAAALALPSRQVISILIALIGVWLTGSRAGLGAALVVLVVAVIFAGRGTAIYRSATRLVVAAQLIVAAALTIFAACRLGDATTSPWCGYLGYAKLAMLSSNSEHLLSSIAGLRMFWQDPLFGAGLGAFIHDSAATGPRPLALHSTLIWLFAEFGAIGAAFFVWPIAAIGISEIRRFRDNDTAGRLLLLAIAAFATMSLVHELMYQRTFWILLGAGVATVATVERSNSQQARGHITA
ncbi:lysylphosphatidylglycerol synthase domain-containing protein [Afipia birgiae]|jgi:hypothetical protein|uniref:lysylphosphatidylglycerol synthase domain-containing protein n=1 Tax=Afipia birgiae TaxID=151414 RepID=UPI0002F84D76|nr:lysylphosphatidylglycerol synthase domain-containing protein [Afipia birgiae]